MSHANTDEGRNRSMGARNGRANFLRNSTCPECGRGGAITWKNLPADVSRACRWVMEGKCTYAVMKDY